MSSINQEKNDIKHKSGTIDQMFAPEYFYMIFRYLQTNKDLYSCILVNRYWANCAVPILWESPFKINNEYNLFPKVIQIYLSCIQKENFHNITLINKPLYDYPSFLKELPFERFLNSAIANNYSERLIVELFKIFQIHIVKLRGFDLSHLHLNFDSLLTYRVLPKFLKYSSLFDRLSYLNCSYNWDVNEAKKVEKALIFNELANNCHKIRNIKATVWCKEEGIALANLISSQRSLKKFSLVNSNNFASSSIQSLQTQSLKSLTFKNMHRNIQLHKSLGVDAIFKSTTFQLDNKAILSLSQCASITELKFKNCEGLILLPINSTFRNLTSLEYTYGNYSIYDSAPPIETLSSLIMMNGKTIENVTINLHWHSTNPPECTQLIKSIAECTINLKYLKTPLYTLEQISLILQTQNQLKKLEMHIGYDIHPYCALFLFINMPFNNFKNSIIQLYFDGYSNFQPEVKLLKQVFEQILYKNYQINNFVLYQRNWPNLSKDKKEKLEKSFPSLKINILINKLPYASLNPDICP
ncbi:5765_t:CDS:2 [Dentiscutata erythropus]|uniref:5765_t:CDS:1 n=1 Tax=Dentiscutata erythropus TaxID=1348616 RepID=A0A9N8ZSP0_9GLOM|nr:5765_t:CDS:2 [Dentiscutata erythropus]